MQFSIGDVVAFSILLVFGLFCAIKYHKLKRGKYLLFLLACICGVFNRNNMIYINGVEINNTMYIETFKYLILATITIVGYKSYKKKELF